MKKKIIYFIKKSRDYLIYISRKRNEIKNIKRKENLVDKIRLSELEEKEITEYFKINYGKKYSSKWHRLYQSYTGIYDKKYYPEILFSTKLEQKLNNRDIAKIIEDKSLVELLYKDIDDLYFPETLVLNCSGIWYDKNRNIITREKAISLLKNSGKKLWKKTVESSSGRSITITNIKDSFDSNTKLTLEELINKYEENFIIQECIENCEAISKLYNESLNTFRIITYIVEGKIYHVPLVLRLGRNGKKVDNIHAGGIFIGLSDDGILKDKAFTEMQEIFESHPDSRVKFKNYKIPNVSKMIELAYKCHGRTPHMKIISWDFAIDKADRIMLIELNIIGQSIWFPQMANGISAFGDNTEYMLNLISNKNK